MFKARDNAAKCSVSGEHFKVLGEGVSHLRRLWRFNVFD